MGPVGAGVAESATTGADVAGGCTVVHGRCGQQATENYGFAHHKVFSAAVSHRPQPGLPAPMGLMTVTEHLFSRAAVPPLRSAETMAVAISSQRSFSRWPECPLTQDHCV